jgi:hypothetical protein
MLNVAMLTVVMLSVDAPFNCCTKHPKQEHSKFFQIFCIVEQLKVHLH